MQNLRAPRRPITGLFIAARSLKLQYFDTDSGPGAVGRTAKQVVKHQFGLVCV